MSETLDILTIKKLLREFSRERDWDKFHNPKNLAMALAGEAGELLEIFQWLTPEEASGVKSNPALKQDVAFELADILLYAIRLADHMEIDLPEALSSKMRLNAEKYPSSEVQGSSRKYHHYKTDK
jgi:dCTP diphosphatase